MASVYPQLHALILETDPQVKCTGVAQLLKQVESLNFSSTPSNHPESIHQPGYPARLALVPPRALTRRGIQKQSGRNVLMHSIAHIEYNAINLALDAAYRFRDQPPDYYHDWLTVAADEARHFRLIQDYLQQNDCDYGDHPAHNSLWDMAVQTDADVIARMALVPRVLEARGLDVTPGMIQRLQSVGDHAAVEILETIYQDEITHVRIGSKWFTFVCEQQGLNPRQTFAEMVDRYFHGELKGPYNIAARLQAGFDQAELDDMNEGQP